MGFVRRRVSGNYFGGSSLVVPGQGVYSIKKYNNFVGKSGIKKDNYDDIPSPTKTTTPTPTPTMTLTPTPTMTPTPSSKVDCKCFNFKYSFLGREDNCVANYLDCDGEVKLTRIGKGDNFLCTTDQKSFELSSDCRGSIVEVVDNGICNEDCGSVPCIKYEISNPVSSICVINYVDCLGDGIIYSVGPLETLVVCSTSPIDYSCKVPLNITNIGICD